MQIPEFKELFLLFVAIISALGAFAAWFKKAKKELIKSVRAPILERLDKTDEMILSNKREAVRATLLAMLIKGDLEQRANREDVLRAYELYLDVGGNFTMDTQIEQAFKAAGQLKVLRKFRRDRQSGIRLEDRNKAFSAVIRRLGGK